MAQKPKHIRGGGYDRVFIHALSSYNHSDYKKLVWEQNPYIDGFIEATPSKPKKIRTQFLLHENILDKIMRSFGLDDGMRLHEPEIYYKPKFREEYNKIIFDPNYDCHFGDGIDLADIVDYLHKNAIHIDAVVSNYGKKNCFDYTLPTEVLQIQSLEDLCDLIYSAKALYCFGGDTAALAAALKKSAHVFYPTALGLEYAYAPSHSYISIRANKELRKTYRFSLGSLSLHVSTKIKDINKFAKLLPTQHLQMCFKNAFKVKKPYRLQPYIPSVSEEEVRNIISIAQTMGSKIEHIFEFGSRYGEDSVAFAKCVNERGINAHIWSFECNENTLPECRKAVKAYPNITLSELAVSDSNGFISFFKINAEETQTTHGDGNQGASSTLKASGKFPIEQYAQDEVRVPCTRLDSFMEANKIPHIDILWMDIQGGELAALKGLGARICDVKLIYSEVEFMEIYENQPLFDDICGYIEQFGFIYLGLVGANEYFANALFVRKDCYTQEFQDLIKRKDMAKWLTK